MYFKSPKIQIERNPLFCLTVIFFRIIPEIPGCLCTLEPPFQNPHDGLIARHIFNANTINNVMQSKLRDFLKKNRSLPNQIKMRRICTSNVNSGIGEMVSGASGGRFDWIR